MCVGGRRSQLKRVRLIGFRPVVTAALIALVDGERDASNNPHFNHKELCREGTE